MDVESVQSSLSTLYRDWKNSLRLEEVQTENYSPPILLSVTDEYCKADTRVLIYGQETYTWNWNEHCLKAPPYPGWWRFGDLDSLADFIRNSDSVEALCWGYSQFRFGEHDGTILRRMLWQAFWEIRDWPGAEAMLSNLVRVDFDGGSILSAPENERITLLGQQKELISAEIKILNPHVCIFLTGPNYDFIFG